MSKVFKITFNILLVLIIVLLVIYFALRVTDKVRIYNVETGSMENKIHPGDYILLLKKSKYYVGDIVTFKVKNYFITHRIVKIENNKVVTKGDANNEEDEEINLDQIEGKVIYYGGILNFVIKFKFVLAAFLVGLYLLSCYFEDDKSLEIDDSNKVDEDKVNENIKAEIETKEQNEVEMDNSEIANAKENDETIQNNEKIEETEENKAKLDTDTDEIAEIKVANENIQNDNITEEIKQDEKKQEDNNKNSDQEASKEEIDNEQEKIEETKNTKKEKTGKRGRPAKKKLDK